MWCLFSAGWLSGVSESVGTAMMTITGTQITGTTLHSKMHNKSHFVALLSLITTIVKD